MIKSLTAFVSRLLVAADHPAVVEWPDGLPPSGNKYRTIEDVHGRGLRVEYQEPTSSEWIWCGDYDRVNDFGWVPMALVHDDRGALRVVRAMERHLNDVAEEKHRLEATAREIVVR